MNRQIRRLGIVLVVLFIALFLNLNYLQVVDAKRLNDHPTNTRAVVRDFSRARGVIQTSDGTVLAESMPSSGQFENQRRYPEANLYSHITGYFSFNFGSDGVERTYNDALTGRTNNLSIDRFGDWLLERERTANVSLTVSNQVQHIAADALADRKGAVVALDPRNGAILAMADSPTYDPNPLASHDLPAATADWNKLNADSDKPLLSRAYRERYFPGSSFKVVTAATALDSGKVTVTEPVFPVLSELPLPQSSQPISNFGGETCGGPLPEALRVSCNTAFAQLGLDLGGPTLADGAGRFGFNQVPPIDLPFGASSLFPDAGTFARDKPALAKSAIGQQDVQATPLQMALVAAGIANNGTVMTPHVMKEIRDSEGEVLQTYDAQAWKEAVPADVARTTRDMMVEVVNSGTGTRAQLPDVQVAGKTGTAQTGRDTSHVWFIGFAPAEAPRVAIAVMLENQPNVSEATGGILAAPIAAEVLQAALAANP
ncbi:MAG TPA: penicillin-binding protein 2 [Acidimicrobiales bacterium]|nr:penicillin-binding protein 2 [Acidimicrobiales bacterium]